MHSGKDYGEDFIGIVLREMQINKKELLKYLGR
jgi:hypothetical protein